MTTWENVRGTHTSSSKASEAVMSALTTGTLSQAGAQIGGPGQGPNPAIPHSHGGHNHHHKQGCFAQWKKILGVDTFVETALHGYKGDKNRPRRNRNPFSRGMVGNCRDFWCDPAPIFGRRENGAAMLGGQPVNYTMMYEAPSRMEVAGDGAGRYESLRNDEEVV